MSFVILDYLGRGFDEVGFPPFSHMLPSLTCWTRGVSDKRQLLLPTQGKQDSVSLTPYHSLLHSMDVSSISRMTTLPVCISRPLPILSIQMDHFRGRISFLLLSTLLFRHIMTSLMAGSSYCFPLLRQVSPLLRPNLDASQCPKLWTSDPGYTWTTQS